MLRDQAHVEDIQAYEQEEERRHHSDLRQFSSSFLDFHMNKDINDACVSSSLRQLFEDAKGVEENIRACKMLRDQAHVEDIQAYETEEEQRYHSYLRHFFHHFQIFI